MRIRSDSRQEDGCTTEIQPIIGNYRLVKSLGSGGFGEVYMAIHIARTESFCALKIIRSERLTPTARMRFDFEIAALSRMEHPHIARLIDSGQAEGQPYLVMELVPGLPINAYCHQYDLDESARVTLLLQICDAVQHAHANGVMHRDLKPANVLVTQQDGVKVIDFGIAKAIDESAFTTSPQTTEATFVGSRFYASPEQLRRNAVIDSRTDVYGLGILFYEVMTGALPTEIKPTGSELTPFELSHAIEHRPFQRPSRSASKTTDFGLSRDWDAIILKCLAKDPKGRYQSVGELIAELHRLVKGLPIEAHPPTIFNEIYRFLRYYRSTAAIVCLVILALAILASVAVHQRNLAEQRLTSLTQQMEVNAELSARSTKAEAMTSAVNSFLKQDVLAPPPEAIPKWRAMSHQQRLILAAETLAERTSEQPSAELEIREWIASTLRQYENFELGAKQYQLAGDLSERLFGAESPTTLRNRYGEADCCNRGLTTALRGRKIAEQLLAYYRKQPNSTSELADSLDLLGRAELETHRPTAAVRALLESLKLKEAGAASIESVAATQRLLADAYNRSGQPTPAIAMLNKALDGFSKVPAAKADIILTRHQLAAIHCEQLEMSEAESLFRENYEASCLLLGDDHAETIRNLRGLAAAINWRGDHRCASRLYLELLLAEQELHGDRQPGKLVSLTQYARVLREVNRCAEAEAIMRYVLRDQSRSFGDVHPHTISSLRTMTSILRSDGQYWNELIWQVRSLWARIRYYRFWHDAVADTGWELVLACRNFMSGQLSKSWARMWGKTFDRARPAIPNGIPYVIHNHHEDSYELTWIESSETVAP